MAQAPAAKKSSKCPSVGRHIALHKVRSRVTGRSSCCRAMGTGLVKFASARRAAAVALALLLAARAAVAGAPVFASALPGNKAGEQTRTLGSKAVMHVYYFAPKTFEITNVDSYFFKDLDACENALEGAVSRALPRARAGDQVDAQCVTIDPPNEIVAPAPQRLPTGVTEL